MATRHKRSHRRSHRRRHRGGASAPNPSSYSSAASYGEAVNGGTNSQYSRVFNQGNNLSNTGNAIIGLQGQKAGRKSHRKRGGFLGLGSVINQAAVPFSILGMQQTYRRKKNGGKHSRRHRH